MSAYGNHTLIAASLLILMLLYYTAVGKVLRVLAPCGRISVTIYVSQAFLHPRRRRHREVMRDTVIR